MFLEILGNKNVYISQVIQGLEFRRNTAMDTQELLIHNGTEGEGTERLEGSLVDILGILVEGFLHVKKGAIKINEIKGIPSNLKVKYSVK